MEKSAPTIDFKNTELAFKAKSKAQLKKPIGFLV